MVAPDPVDIRLLTLVAESGKAAVHEIAARLGMDPREVAARLVALSGTGLPLIVGVECDPYGLRAALANAWPQPRGYPPAPAPVRPPAQPQPPQQPQPQQSRPPAPVAAAPRPPDAISTWGPPQSSSWARGDQPTRPAWTAPPSQANPVPTPDTTAEGAKGTVGETLRTDVLAGGEQLAVQLVEVVDPADVLFSAAGYRLREGERAVVVHTEVTNLATTPFPQLPDLYLVLVADDGQTVAKAPVTLSSRPPHRIGPRPGETAGGHTVYVLSESTPITSVRWTFRPDEERHTLVWTV